MGGPASRGKGTAEVGLDAIRLGNDVVVGEDDDRAMPAGRDCSETVRLGRMREPAEGEDDNDTPSPADADSRKRRRGRGIPLGEMTTDSLATPSWTASSCMSATDDSLIRRGGLGRVSKLIADLRGDCDEPARGGTGGRDGGEEVDG